MIEIDPIWLLLPLAAVMGWYVARKNSERVSGQKVNKLSSSYFKGLNYLLNEQPDKAIEVFLELSEVDTDTVETHLALGNLFRRRGEVARAIKFHQNLISRSNLSPEQRTYAFLELGEDYMRAGLLDRAEDLFSELIEIGAQQPPALRHLIAIYQQEQDWEKAIDAARLLEKASGKDESALIAQFQCELADQAIKKNDFATARKWVQQARRTDADSARGSMLEARLAELEGDYKTAIRALMRVPEQDMAYLPEILGPLIHCLRENDQVGRARQFLRDMLDRYAGISPTLHLADLIRQEEGEKAAAHFVGDRLRIRPSVRGLHKLIDLTLVDSRGAAKKNLLALQELTRRLLDEAALYRCNQCGFGARSHHWQCPSCKSWDSVKPVSGVSGS